MSDVLLEVILQARRDLNSEYFMVRQHAARTLELVAEVERLRKERSEAERALDRIWLAFGCEKNPDGYTSEAQSAQAKMMEEMARESADNSGRMAREAREAQAALIRVSNLHNADGYRYFGRLPGQPMPEPEGEAYCTNCEQTAPCDTLRAIQG